MQHINPKTGILQSDMGRDCGWSNQLSRVNEQEIEFAALLEHSVTVAVDCRCGETHYCTRPMTAAERRERNRNMVAWQQHVDAYLTFGQAEDAWQSRTLNLDGMMAAGRI